MFTAVVLGGLGSVLGAVAGGVAVGVIQSVSTLVLPMQLQNLALFAIFILVLALRPEGASEEGRLMTSNRHFLIWAVVFAVAAAAPGCCRTRATASAS